jgi:hypothetical protein
VEEAVRAPDAADAASVAVPLAPVDVVEEAAPQADVCPEPDAARAAGGRGGLPGVAEAADDLADGRALELVALRGVPLARGRALVVAVAAPEGFSAAGSDELAATAVVLAAVGAPGVVEGVLLL